MSEQNDKDKKREIKVTVDNEQTKLLAEELAREKIKNEKLVDYVADKEVREDHNDLANLKIQAFEKFHNENFLHAETKNELSQMITNFINEISQKANPPSGSVLVPQQYGAKPQDLWTKPYSSWKEMVDDLRAKSRSGSKEAESYLNSLYEKHREFKMADPHRPEPTFNPNSPEALDELGLVQKDGFLTPSNKEDGDIGQLQKKWREERKRRMEEGNQQ